ncbi:RDD family protein [Schlesneria paludicola]|uniref:RDD family protein n=1 Tax=Schlesneria paludicola TaxID=360056 RepID=UPI0004928D9B|nr:RDD family protein [Schlesneria paludicola]
MSSRQPGYLWGLLLLAVFATTPFLAAGGLIGMMRIGGPQWSVPALVHSTLRSIPWIGEGATNIYRLMYAPLWNDQFVCLEGLGQREGIEDWKWMLVTIDPETGKNHSLSLSFQSRVVLFPTVFGDRLWLVDPTMNNPESFEIVDGRAQRSEFSDDPFQNLVPTGQRFLLDGEPARVESGGDGFVISTHSDGDWNDKYAVVLPNPNRISMIGSVGVYFSQASQMSCLNLGDEIHVLLKVGGYSLYRRGLQLKPLSDESDGPAMDDPDSLDGALILSETVSVPESKNPADAVAGWSLVREEIGHDIPNLLFVNGEPAVLIVDDVHTLNPIGHLYRFDGTEWKLSATCAFPFTYNIRVVACQNGMKSYVSTIQAMGVTRIYSIEQDGIRATECVIDAIPKGLLSLGMMLMGVLFLTTTLLGVGCWIMMCRYTRADYGFGDRAVRLASLGQRGLARGIDIVLVASLIIGFGWIVNPHFDWLTLAQALECQVSHPIVKAASELVIWVGIWMAFIAFAFVAIQGRWGVTPGKWCVGIRTLQSTLRPCGFSRSLAREIVMCVDTCNATWWVPGILSLALTSARQRLGDLVADTIVVEASRDCPEGSAVSSG